MQTEYVTIAKDGTTSTVCDIHANTYVGVIIPAMDSCTVSIYGCASQNGTFVQMQNTAGTAAFTSGTITTTSVLWVVPFPVPFRYLKVVASAAQTTAARTLTVLAKS